MLSRCSSAASFSRLEAGAAHYVGSAIVDCTELRCLLSSEFCDLKSNANCAQKLARHDILWQGFSRKPKMLSSERCVARGAE